jgi:hypothetical protein
MKINHIIKEFVTPQATAQDPGLEREKDVDVIIFGRMPQDFTYNLLIEALEAVLPREYPPGSSQNTQGVPESPAERIGGKIAKNGGAVVTTKPLSIAQKLVKTFQTYGIKCRIDAPGLEEDARPPIAPDPQNYDSDVDYYNDRDADPIPPDTDADYENMDDAESDDWFDESKEKVGNMDADAFDDALARMKKLAGAGPLKTVYDPARRVYKNVPHAVQPAQQPKKAR